MKFTSAVTTVLAAMLATASACDDDRITYTNKCKACGWQKAGMVIHGNVFDQGVDVYKNGKKLKQRGDESDANVMGGDPVSGDYGLHCNVVFYGKHTDADPFKFTDCHANYGKTKGKDGKVKNDTDNGPSQGDQKTECCVEFDC